MDKILEEVKRLKAIADTGLLYSTNEYDIERYSELRSICFRMLNEITGHTVDLLQESFPLMKDYPTAKVDVRGMVLSPDKKILLVKESLDGKWSLPGGWADVGFSPKEIIIKEFKEETGLDIVPKNLLAIFDKKMHPHPPQPFHVYKMVFYCEAFSKELVMGFDVLDVRYFSADDLPDLSEDRILKSQIQLVYNKIIASDLAPHFD